MIGAGPELRVADVVREYAASRGDHAAVVMGQRSLTYERLDERSSRLARALLDAGVGPGARLAYLDRTSPEVIELLFAVAKIGAVLVPLNWRLAEPELERVVADCEATLLIAGPDYEELAERLGRSRMTIGCEYEEWLGSFDAIDPGGRGRPEDPVVQMYTSGTTGVPKGVLTTHRNLTAAAETSPRWRFDAETISMTPLPMFHVSGIGWSYLGLWNGATTILVRQFSPRSVLEILEHDRVTNTVLVPAMLQALVSDPSATARDFSALRSIAYGGAPITTPVLKASLRTFACELFGVYGLTETTGGVVVLGSEDHDPDGPRESLLRSTGKPYPWVEMRIVDPSTGVAIAQGATGEVWLKGPNVTPGYFNRPEETAVAITADGWLRTGDGGYVDQDGYLFLTDRIKDMIVSGGENVYPIEVEEVLAQHPAVAGAAVIGVPDDRWGETVLAVVVPRKGAKPGAEELVDFARGRLAGYKLPRSVEFVEDLPRTPTGKVLKRDLRRRYMPADP